MVDLNLQADLNQTLSLYLAPRMLQMLKVLSLPYLELVENISKEAEENVMLEVERRDEYVEFLRYLTSDRKIKKEADFSEYPGLENLGRVEKTLEEYLLEQLEIEDLDETYKLVAHQIIENIDDHGYLLAYPQLRENIMRQHSLSRPTVDKILKMVQSFEPDGVGARDLKECLTIQLEAHNFENPELEEIIAKVIHNHLEDIEAQNLAKISASLGIPASGVQEITDFIKQNLNPYPASSFGGQAKQVIPSFAVEKREKGYNLINLESRYGPIIKLSNTYLKMLEDPKADEQTKAFLKEKLKKAKDLLSDFSKRGETLEKIARRIIEQQGEFLEKGMLWLKPLSQKSLADEFGLHPSTISRAVAEKYVQTPQGIFPLKFMCPRGPKGITPARLKSMLIEIINREDKKNPLTDEKLTGLMVEKGALINRRTVAFYRKALDLPTALDRIQNDN